MKLKRVIAKAMISGAIGLPSVGLGIAAANAAPSPPPPVPAFELAPDVAAAAGNGNGVVNPAPTSTVGERTAYWGPVNPHGWVARDMRQFGPFGVLLGPVRGFFG